MGLNWDAEMAVSIETATLAKAAAWQALTEQLQAESGACTIAESANCEPPSDNAPAVTYLVVAEQGATQTYVGMGSVYAGEVGLALLADCQGLGLGQALLAALIDWAEAQAVATLWLDVLLTNAVAQHVYAKAGFVAVGEPHPVRRSDGQTALSQRMELT